MKPAETVKTSETRVACDGGKAALGHPRVYLTLTKDGATDCPYCGRRFVLDGDGAKAGSH